MKLRSSRLLVASFPAMAWATGAAAQTGAEAASTSDAELIYWLIAYAVGAIVAFLVARHALAPALAERRWGEAKRHAMRNAELDKTRRIARYSNEWFRVYFEYDLDSGRTHILDFPPTGGAGYKLADFLELGLPGAAVTVFGTTVTATAAEQAATAHRVLDLVAERVPNFNETYWLHQTGARDWLGNNATNFLILVGFVLVGGWLGMRSLPRLLRERMERDDAFWSDFRATLLALEDSLRAQEREEERKRAEKLESERAWRANNEALLRALQGRSSDGAPATPS